MTFRFTLMGLGTPLAYPDDIEQFKSQFSLNTGNLLYNYASQILCDLTPNRVGWNTSASKINSECEGLLIPMANHLGDHVDLSISGPKLENIDRPVVIFGIGVQNKIGTDPQLPDGTKRWIEVVCRLAVNKSTNISTRGLTSTEAIAKNVPGAKSSPLGCPSFLINRHIDLGERILSRLSTLDPSHIAVAVSAGNPYEKQLLEVERSLIQIVQAHQGSYIVQHPQALLELSLGYPTHERTLELVRTRLFPELELANLKSWMRKYSRVYASVHQWMLDMTRYDIHIGTRIHGSQAAIQAGVPSVCLYIDTRTKELCEKMNIPHISATELVTPIKINEVISLLKQWDWAKYDQNRLATARETLSFLVQNTVKPSEHLLRLAQVKL